ncbi:putative mediator of RNA polymerase II transcription subunit 26 [Leguminivora glycinivorella]|uniref:putative mediator of RNA polymerase II transcription subunit 26 n=1 Tax=Leguminivora glycinivorella TaxID=1035111 RepID=UPI00200E3A42|nr:putative mediator of RNA polymerase II transcription subunit 26 [Leguminivora glycinivorella]
MRLITSLAAILAVASSEPVPYTTQPTEHFANNAESYQSQLEVQQQGIYADQSHYSQQDFSQSEAGYSQGHTVAFPSGQTSFAGQSTFAGQKNFAGQNFQSQRPSTEKSARIVSYQNENKGKNYQYSYETENGIKVQEQGSVQGKTLRAQGGYSYTGDDGQVYTVTYTADEHGFRPQGAHLPTPPPIPEAIQKSIEFNQREAANNNGVYDDGSYKEEIVLQQQRHRSQQQQSQRIQQINDLQPHQYSEIQPVQQIPIEHQIPEIQVQQHQEQQLPEYQPEIQQVQPQVQQFQHGQEGYQQVQQQYQQEQGWAGQEATTAGYSGWK